MGGLRVWGLGFRVFRVMVQGLDFEASSFGYTK